MVLAFGEAQFLQIVADKRGGSDIVRYRDDVLGGGGGIGAGRGCVCRNHRKQIVNVCIFSVAVIAVHLGAGDCDALSGEFLASLEASEARTSGAVAWRI